MKKVKAYMHVTQLIILGTNGRMGQAIASLVGKDGRFSIIAGTTRPGSSPKASAFPVYENLAEIDPKSLTKAVLLDFSHHSQSESHLNFAQKQTLPILIGCTGHDANFNQVAHQAAQSTPVLLAANTSIMATIFKALVAQAAALMPAVSARILDIHHAQKKDAPSGTASLLKKAIEENAKKIIDPIEIASFRAADIAGEHTVFFFKEFERLELVHRVHNRAVFAEGALNAALFLSRAKPGLYGMNDVLALN
jgi:4-hydroxy-tetrahydrodipicolinate reductase